MEIEHIKLWFKNFQQLFIRIENCWLSRRALQLRGGIVGEIILHGKTINYFFTLHWSKENFGCIFTGCWQETKKTLFLFKKRLKYSQNLFKLDHKCINKITIPYTVSNQASQNVPRKAGAENSMNKSQQSAWLVR